MYKSRTFVFMFRLISFIAIYNVLLLQSVEAQVSSCYLHGKITEENGTPISVADVMIYNQDSLLAATTTNNEGHYALRFDCHQLVSITLNVSHLGFVPTTLSITNIQDTFVRNASLAPLFTALPSVVVSAGKTEQRLEETTISIIAVPASLIENKNPTDLQQTVDQVPGVHVTEGQVNIRSGSGWSYGAGTRVLTLIDDLPLISPDANQVLWPLVPFESLEQMEVIKGAASALYGSSAMNGVINVRTRSPFSKHTSINVFSGMYDAPAREDVKWSESPIVFHGLQVSHSDFKRLGKGKLGYLIGANGLWDPGFRWNAMDNRARLHWKTAYKQPLNNRGVIEFGLNGSVSFRESGQALVWQNANQAYMAQDSSVTITNGTTYFIDPYIEMTYGNNEIQHSDKMQLRILGINNIASDDVNSFDNASNSVLLQYQHQATFEGATITSGIFGLFAQTQSQIFGNHISSNQAIFLQGDFPWKRFNVSLGARYEMFMVNDIRDERPVFRAGLNYRLFKHTNLFTNFGEGFRFPSIAELYTQTNVGTINIFPSENLRPEFGRTVEIGVKQGIGNGKRFSSRIEAVAYSMHFNDMIEFMFNQWLEPTQEDPFRGIGFRSVNISSVQINGLEFSYIGEVYYKRSKIEFLTGYTYTNPRVINPDMPIAGYQNLTYRSSSSDTTDILKYRFQHLFRADIQYVWNTKLRIGGSLRYNDFMQAVDQAFVTLLPGVRSTRERLYMGDFFIDVRIGYQINDAWSVNLICDNLLNREFMMRPAMLGMPRRFMIQSRFSF